jgi:hypothetical protein
LGFSQDWLSGYLYRRQITINNTGGETAIARYTMKITLDTASLITANKMLPSGNDLRIIFWNGATNVSLDREVKNVNTPNTEVFFALQAEIPAGGSDGNYYLYYGNPQAEAPEVDLNNVYLMADDFEDGNLDGWSIQTTGNGTMEISTEQTAGGSQYAMKLTADSASNPPQNTNIIYQPRSFPLTTLKISADVYLAQTDRTLAFLLYEDQVDPSSELTRFGFADEGDWEIQYQYVPPRWNHFQINGAGYSANTWYRVETFLYFGSVAQERLVCFVNGVQGLDQADGIGRLPTDSIDYFAVRPCYYTAGGTYYVDNIKVTVALTQPPDYVLGNEETSTPSPEITGITPSFGFRQIEVVIVGNNFGDGAEVKLTRQGEDDIEATNIQVSADGTEIRCTLDLTGAAFGEWNVVVTNPDTLSGILENGFTVKLPAPTITSITPDVIELNATGDTVQELTIIGTNFHPGTEVKTVKGTTEIEAVNVSINMEGTQITYQITFPEGTEAGEWQVVVTLPDGQSAEIGIVVSPTCVETPHQGSSLTELYPNPVNSGCWLPVGRVKDEPGKMKIRIYNILGQLVCEIQFQSSKVYWSGQDSLGSTVGSGVYFYEVAPQGRKRMIVLK